MSINKPKLAGILIAAGNSSRLGQSKQLIKYQNLNLLNRSVALAEFATQNVWVILGSEAEQHSHSIVSKSVNLINNENWQQGMGTSIAKGIACLSEEYDGALILLCDQWALEQSDLFSLISRWQKNTDKIVCSQYYDQKANSEISGAPAIFPSAYFKQLSNLRDTGARKILQQNPQDVISLNLPNAGHDLDTPEDLTKLLSRRS